MTFSVTQRGAWITSPERFAGEWQGEGCGAALSVVANYLDVGDTIKPHRHPYAETFIVRRGVVALTVGDESIVCKEGQIIVTPPHVFHSFRNIGSVPLEMIDIHESGVFITEWAT
jgi:mannose-6-phosphate isomerase-like protein (cupin superfamily)